MFDDQEAFTMTSPPEPSAIWYHDLQHDPEQGRGRMLAGYAMTAGLYFAYLPIVIWITNVAKQVDMGPLQSVWAGLAPTMGLQVMVAMLPTFLITIFRTFFILKADVYAQKNLQNWYFVFQVVFVIMATAVGTNINGFMMTLLQAPTEVFGLLADTMPQATHFFMNFLVLQWVTHVMGMMRHVILGKYLAFSKLVGEDEAKKMAEPEDQDYYGMGSRSARSTINLCIGIVYGTLCPPMNLLCWVNSYICRAVYGYLCPFAETRKADLGGAFFHSSLKHLFTGNIIYCILMIGVLARRGADWYPCAVAAPSLFYVIWSMNRFEVKFSWEYLSFQKAVQSKPAGKNEGKFVQPELCEPLEELEADYMAAKPKA